MPRINANITLMFQELDFMDRFKAAAEAGFSGVEYQRPYEHSKDDLKDCLMANNLTPVLHNLPSGDWGAGERGIACLPDRVDEFRQGVDLAIDYASASGCVQFNCLAGIPGSDVSRQQAHDTFVQNLKFAAKRMDGVGIKLLIEAINTVDFPGFFLNTTAQSAQILSEVGSSNLYIQYDVYHMQIMEGDLCRTIETHLDRIAHIQIADNPGRHEPGTGEINFPNLFRHLDRIGYSGWVGAEYLPAGETLDGLDWFRRAVEDSTQNSGG